MRRLTQQSTGRSDRRLRPLVGNPLRGPSLHSSLSPRVDAGGGRCARHHLVDGLAADRPVPAARTRRPTRALAARRLDEHAAVLDSELTEALVRAPGFCTRADVSDDLRTLHGRPAVREARSRRTSAAAGLLGGCSTLSGAVRRSRCSASAGSRLLAAVPGKPRRGAALCHRGQGP